MEYTFEQREWMMEYVASKMLSVGHILFCTPEFQETLESYW